MVKDPAIVRTGDGAKRDAIIAGLERLDLFGAIGGQAILQIGSCERRRELPQVRGRSPDLAYKLAETPVGGREGPV